MSATLLRYQEAAEYLGVAVSTLQRLVAQKRIGHHKLGNLVRFTTSDLDLYVASTHVEPRVNQPTPIRHARSAQPRIGVVPLRKGAR